MIDIETLKKLIHDGKPDEVIMDYIESNFENKVDSLKEKYNFFLAKFNTLFNKNHRYTVDNANRLKTRLKSFSFEEILEAVENLAKSDWHRGINDSGWVADPKFLLRNDAQVDKWLNEKPKVVENKEFEEPSKQLGVEMVLYAQLATGGYEDVVKNKYAGMVQWLRNRNEYFDFENRSRLVAWLLKDGVQSNAAIDQHNLECYEKYLRTMEANKLEPKKEIVAAGEQLKQKLLQ